MHGDSFQFSGNSIQGKKRIIKKRLVLKLFLNLAQKYWMHCNFRTFGILIYSPLYQISIWDQNRVIVYGNGNLLQYSCLENPMGRGTWVTVHWVAKSQTWLSDWAYMEMWGKKETSRTLEDSGPCTRKIMELPFFLAHRWTLSISPIIYQYMLIFPMN